MTGTNEVSITTAKEDRRSPAALPEIFLQNRIIWSIAVGLREKLFGTAGFLLDQWIQAGQATLVKKGPGRAVYRVTLDSSELFVKHFHTEHRRFPRLFRAGRASKEYRLARELFQRGISSIEPVALGERRRLGRLAEEFLLSQAIPEARTLDRHIEDDVPSLAGRFDRRRRSELTDAIADLVARLHAAGFEHRDLHERNLVLDGCDRSPPRLYLLDLHEVRRHGELSYAVTLRELSRLGRYLSIRTERTDRLRFIRRYVRSRGWPETMARRLAIDAERVTLESRADFWRRRDARALGRQSQTRRIDRGANRIWIAADLPKSLIEELSLHPERFLSEEGVCWWKRGRKTSVVRLGDRANVAGMSLVMKQYRHQPLREFIARLGRESAPLRAWRNAHGLILREIPTPRPVMLIDRHVRGLPAESYLLTEEVPGAEHLVEHVRRRLDGVNGVPRRRQLAEWIPIVARVIRRMHERGVTHPDLKSTNVLVGGTDDAGAPQLWLIDLDGVQTWSRVPERLKVQNLARFFVSFHNVEFVTRTDGLRFLKQYLGAGALDRHRLRWYWQSIGRAYQRKIDRNRRRGRGIG